MKNHVTEPVAVPQARVAQPSLLKRFQRMNRRIAAVLGMLFFGSLFGFFILPIVPFLLIGRFLFGSGDDNEDGPR